MNSDTLKIQLLQNIAIQNYLLEHGSNDEVINTKIEEIRKQLLEIEKNRNKI
jgi:hypothetical protein